MHLERTLALACSYDIHMHLLHYVNPRLQRYYIRVLWLVPVFG